MSALSSSSSSSGLSSQPSWDSMASYGSDLFAGCPTPIAWPGKPPVSPKVRVRLLRAPRKGPRTIIEEEEPWGQFVDLDADEHGESARRGVIGGRGVLDRCVTIPRAAAPSHSAARGSARGRRPAIPRFF